MNIADDTEKGRTRRAATPASSIKVEPVSPWPRRRRRLLRGLAYLVATLLLSLTFSIAALLAAEALDSAAIAIALAVTAAIMLLTRGLDTPTIATLCAMLTVTASQASGLDLLVAGQNLIERHLGKPQGESENNPEGNALQTPLENRTSRIRRPMDDTRRSHTLSPKHRIIHDQIASAAPPKTASEDNEVPREITQKWGFGMAPAKPETQTRRLSAANAVTALLEAETVPEPSEALLSSISEIKGLFNRVKREDQWDHFTARSQLGYPEPRLAGTIADELADFRSAVKTADQTAFLSAQSNLRRLPTRQALGACAVGMVGCKGFLPSGSIV